MIAQKKRTFTHDEAQLLFDWLVPTREPLLSPQSVARLIGRSARFVYDLCEEGRLEAFSPHDREVRRKMITRRSILLVLAEDAEFDPGDYDSRVDKLLEGMTRSQLARLAAKATALANRL